MRLRTFLLALAGAAVLGALGMWAVLRLEATPPAAEAAVPVEKPSSQFPGGKPIDAAAIQSGTLAVERLPPEITGALEVHSAEIEKTAREVATRQARITGVCGPGSAIRLVGADGSVVCQRLPKGVASVSAVAASPRISTTGTTQGTVPGAVRQDISSRSCCSPQAGQVYT